MKNEERRNVPIQIKLHKQVRIACAKEECTITEFVEASLRFALKNKQEFRAFIDSRALKST